MQRLLTVESCSLRPPLDIKVKVDHISEDLRSQSQSCLRQDIRRNTVGVEWHVEALYSVFEACVGLKGAEWL